MTEKQAVRDQFVSEGGRLLVGMDTMINHLKRDPHNRAIQDSLQHATEVLIMSSRVFGCPDMLAAASEIKASLDILGHLTNPSEPPRHPPGPGLSLVYCRSAGESTP